MSNDFWKDVLGPILGYIVGGVGLYLWVKLKAQIKKPKETENELADFKVAMSAGMADLNTKFDTFSKYCADSSENNKQFQTLMFKSSDYTLQALTAQTGGIRTLADSVCNGNKPDAMKLCDEADALCKEGQRIKQDYLIDHSVCGGM
jgi:uncharacterized membrane-anchored protein YhcB (DUF1043 family)